MIYCVHGLMGSILHVCDFVIIVVVSDAVCMYEMTSLFVPRSLGQSEACYSSALKFSNQMFSINISLLM